MQADSNAYVTPVAAEARADMETAGHRTTGLTAAPGTIASAGTGSMQTCPECHSPMPVHMGYVTWCPHCNWNVQPYQPDPPRNLFESMYIRAGKKLGQGLFESLKRSEALAPSPGPTSVLAFLLALLVHAFTLATVLAGVVLLVEGFGHLALMILGLLCLGLAWALRPRLPRVPKEGMVLREEYPALYALTDKVARYLGAAPIDVIVLTGEFNAAFSKAGWKRRNVLYLGLPLLAVLEPQEQVAVLGHELAHQVNGDPTRGLIVGSAVRSLATWYSVLDPDGPARGFIAMLASWLMLGLAQIPRFFTYLLLNLLWQDMQRAEYLADALAAKASGTGAALSALDKLHLGDTVAMTVHQVAMNSKGKDLFAELHARASSVPGHERERLRKVERLLATRLDATHPPTAYRLDLLEAHPTSEPGVTLSSEDAEKVEAELRRAQPAIQAEIVDAHLSSVGSL